MTVDSGKSEAVFPGISMLAYDVSPDDKQVVYATAGSDGKSQLWLAPIDRSSAPKQIGQSGETTPYFGPRGKILFQMAEGNANYLEEMNEDGSGRAKVVPYPIDEVTGISPGRKWVMGMVPYSDGKSVVPMDMAIPLDGGPPVRICASYCLPTWSSSGKFLFIAVEAPTETSPGRSLAIPVGPGESLAALPPGGVKAGAEPDEVPGLPIGEPRLAGARQRPLSFRLCEYHGAPEPVSNFATLTEASRIYNPGIPMTIARPFLAAPFVFALLLAPFAIGRAQASENMTPLLLAVQDAPVPFMGSDGKIHLVYELGMTNFSSAEIAVEKVEIVGDGSVLQTLDTAAIASRLQPAGLREAAGTLPKAPTVSSFSMLRSPREPRSLRSSRTALRCA